MERNRNVKALLEGNIRDDQADEAVAENDVRSLNDLELVLAAGGDSPIAW